MFEANRIVGERVDLDNKAISDDNCVGGTTDAPENNGGGAIDNSRIIGDAENNDGCAVDNGTIVGCAVDNDNNIDGATNMAGNTARNATAVNASPVVGGTAADSEIDVNVDNNTFGGGNALD
jgi:hypothetical protein